ncbi:hypothetical protein BY458DRAFT_516080 [Sporodiniella umbellata]|nr:hypothetical protein BY458DRAFT_516080 [Sporodiniella umbellata]
MKKLSFENRSEKEKTFRSGFKTANGKPLDSPSEDSFEKVQALFQDENSALCKLNDPTVQTYELSSVENNRTGCKSSFSTASGKRLNAVPEELQRKAKQFFEGYSDAEMLAHPSSFLLDKDVNQKKRSAFDPERNIAQNQPMQRSLFSTASGKKMKRASEKAMEKVKSLFQEPESLNTKEETQSSYLKVPSHFTDYIEPDYKRSAEKPLSGSLSNPKCNKRPLLTHRPFKSPTTRYNLETNLKRAATRGASSKPVFDLTIYGERKKLKDLGRPQQYTQEQLLSKNIPLDVVQMTRSRAKNYSFLEGKWGPLQAQECIVKLGALVNKISIGWVENHYGWIVWKLACQIRSFPNDFIHEWKKETVVHQLLYRYEREINQGHRSVLKKIVEQDDVAAKHMILVISDIINIDSPLLYNTSSRYYIEVTDGWEAIPACIDLKIERAITKKTLKVGFKLSICGTRLIKIPQPSGKTKFTISLSSNQCLPASWDAKLGYHPRACITRSISSIFQDGGMVAALDVIVCRKFPMFYKESLDGGKSIIRTAHEEEKAQIQLEEERIKAGEQALAEQGIQSGCKNKDTASAKGNWKRKVSTYFKLKICDYRLRRKKQAGWATLLSLNMNEMNYMDIEEGARFKIFSVVPYCPKTKAWPEVHLKTTPRTRWELVPASQLPDHYIPRSISSCSNAFQSKNTVDFDLAVIVMHASPVTTDVFYGRKMWRQKLLVIDQSFSMCQVETGLYSMSPQVVRGQIIGLTNLKLEYYDSKYNITCFKTQSVSEILFSGFSKKYMRDAIDSLRSWLEQNKVSVSKAMSNALAIAQ